MGNEYGEEFVLDLHDCNSDKFNRKDLRRFFKELCEIIDMVRGPLYFWDYKGHEELKDVDPDHVVGTSAIQFIQTSNITVHCLDRLGKVFINVFSCKGFSGDNVVEFCSKFFDGEVANHQYFLRY